jgi:hypothetical protein
MRLWSEAAEHERRDLVCTAAPVQHKLSGYTIFHLIAWRKVKNPPEGFDGFVADLIALVSLWPLFGELRLDVTRVGAFQSFSWFLAHLCWSWLRAPRHFFL